MSGSFKPGTGQRHVNANQPKSSQFGFREARNLDRMESSYCLLEIREIKKKDKDHNIRTHVRTLFVVLC